MEKETESCEEFECPSEGKVTIEYCENASTAPKAKELCEKLGMATGCKFLKTCCPYKNKKMEIQ